MARAFGIIDSEPANPASATQIAGSVPVPPRHPRGDPYDLVSPLEEPGGVTVRPVRERPAGLEMLYDEPYSLRKQQRDLAPLLGQNHWAITPERVSNYLSDQGMPAKNVRIGDYNHKGVRKKRISGSFPTNRIEHLAPDLIAARAKSSLAKEWREGIAAREAKDQPDQWGAFNLNEGGFALSRYQMRSRALVDAGVLRIGPAGTKDQPNYEWTGKNGVSSWRDFVNNPAAQDAALEDFVDKLDQRGMGLRVHRGKGETTRVRDYVGRPLKGVKKDFTITRGGLVAAMHREGEGNVQGYLKWLDENGMNSRAGINAMGDLVDRIRR
jgi:hypothetical protein